ncbi:permease [Rhizobium helianthi]|uniref:Permease n=1 Tax=Rhizobium helianthi TaxID=1132695 RepID=A0ABW4MAQ8_9HYPH
MNGNINGAMLGLIAFCVLTEACREICFKFASIREGGHLFLHPAMAFGVVFWAVELVAWTYVLAHVPLSVAFPLMASSYAIIALSGAVVFEEPINWRHCAGVALVTGGVICVGVTGS